MTLLLLVTLASAPLDTLPRPALDRRPDSTAVAEASRRIQPGDLIRVRGDFGPFLGHAALVGPAGMAGLRADPDRSGHADEAVPGGPVTWDRIDSVDKRGNSAGAGAVIGGITVGVVAGVFTMAAATGLGGGTTRDAAGAVVAGTAAGALAGALIGALIGAVIPVWHNVYAGP